MAPPVALQRSLGLRSACAVIVGNIIGSGIFVSPRGVLTHSSSLVPMGNIIGSGIFVSPRGVLTHSGSLAVGLLVWLGAGLISGLGALCYAELGVAIPEAGGDYAYVAEVYGGLTGFLRLWLAVLVVSPTNQAVLALTFASYALQPFMACGNPPEAAIRILATACLLLLSWVNSRSSLLAARVQDAFTACKLLALALIIGTGIVRMAQGHTEWLTPSRSFSPHQPYSAGGLALSFLQGSFAYSGWNFLNYVTEELVDPHRNLPLAICISLPLVTFLYVMANVAYVTVMAPTEIVQSDAVAVTFGQRALPALQWVLPLAVTMSTFGGVNGSLFTCSRLFYAGARRGHLPALLAMIHVDRKTPVPALLVTCITTVLMLVTGDIYTLINYVGIVNHVWYGVTVTALLILRRQRPHMARPIKVPLWVPLLFMLQWLVLLLFSLWAEPWVCSMAAAVTLGGVPLYLLGVRWAQRLPALQRAMAWLTLVGQKLFFVVYPHSDSEPHSDPQPHSDTQPHSDPQPHSDTQPHSDPQPHSDTQPHSDPQPHSDSEPHSDPQPHSDSHPTSDSQPHSETHK